MSSKTKPLDKWLNIFVFQFYHTYIFFIIINVTLCICCYSSLHHKVGLIN